MAAESELVARQRERPADLDRATAADLLHGLTDLVPLVGARLNAGSHVVAQAIISLVHKLLEL